MGSSDHRHIPLDPQEEVVDLDADTKEATDEVFCNDETEETPHKIYLLYDPKTPQPVVKRLPVGTIAKHVGCDVTLGRHESSDVLLYDKYMARFFASVTCRTSTGNQTSFVLRNTCQGTKQKRIAYKDARGRVSDVLPTQEVELVDQGRFTLEHVEFTVGIDLGDMNSKTFLLEVKPLNGGLSEAVDMGGHVNGNGSVSGAFGEVANLETPHFGLSVTGQRSVQFPPDQVTPKMVYSQQLGSWQGHVIGAGDGKGVVQAVGAGVGHAGGAGVGHAGGGGVGYAVGAGVGHAGGGGVGYAVGAGVGHAVGAGVGHGVVPGAGHAAVGAGVGHVVGAGMGYVNGAGVVNRTLASVTSAMYPTVPKYYNAQTVHDQCMNCSGHSAIPQTGHVYSPSVTTQPMMNYYTNTLHHDQLLERGGGGQLSPSLASHPCPHHGQTDQRISGMSINDLAKGLANTHVANPAVQSPITTIVTTPSTNDQSPVLYPSPAYGGFRFPQAQTMHMNQMDHMNPNGDLRNLPRGPPLGLLHHTGSSSGQSVNLHSTSPASGQSVNLHSTSPASGHSVNLHPVRIPANVVTTHAVAEVGGSQAGCNGMNNTSKRQPKEHEDKSK
ncbi:uncharacterized protein LOC124290530 isoform X3 [Haliotis rubra]|uniref:uncharacterized protein LOC124290530 isoform X2 n=1 Tax=Haliotis rubra TaxID=36100 RepID=UPI001EE62507|nr:uncharacterized protein LOC124290530 isoform X2 [Haliotis rubra]XP_046583237.1 uncharacterized protein LOC124290530 isoform X3 [Haliotis rubra]